MKKVFLLILSIFYLVASSGAVVHLHYCMDKLIAWGLWEKPSPADKCDTCGMPKGKQKKNCCKDESKFVKIVKDQKTSSIEFKLIQVIIAEQSLYITSNILPYSFIKENIPFANAPPLYPPPDAFLLNCDFRI